MVDYAFSMYELEYFLLIVCRISGLIFTAPFYSMNSTPRRIKVGLAIFVSYLLYQLFPMEDPLEYNGMLGYSALVIKELSVGLLLGFGCNICTMIVTFAGRIMDMEAGLSMANLMDPTTKEQASVSGVLYQQAVLLMLMATGMYQYIMKALAESYILIPVNGATFRTDELLDVMLKFMADYILIGFRICLPIFCVMIILNAVLGILAKVAPQMNMFAVGFQMKVLTGLVVMFFTASMLPLLSDMLFTEMKTMMVAFVEAMM